MRTKMNGSHRTIPLFCTFIFLWIFIIYSIKNMKTFSLIYFKRVVYLKLFIQIHYSKIFQKFLSTKIMFNAMLDYRFIKSSDKNVQIFSYNIAELQG